MKQTTEEPKLVTRLIHEPYASGYASENKLTIIITREITVRQTMDLLSEAMDHGYYLITHIDSETIEIERYTADVPAL